ncbi:MAG: NACHT domain-containing protein [Rhodothermales bacterium]|nr:NACHT domain-containing protein [Rhodothermales bacterium]
MEPLREDSHRMLMQILFNQGNRDAAIVHYNQLCKLLRRELNISPDRETDELLQKIKADAIERPATALRATPNPGSPPDDTTSETAFYGRSAELETLSKNLPEYRLITLLGMGGVGKTHLAREFARSQANHFVDGVYFIPLASLHDVDNVALKIAEVLGLDVKGADDPGKQLCECIGSRSLLLILDNFEHLLEARSLVANLLQNCPRLHMIITSRQKLQLSYETILPVAGLDYESRDTYASEYTPACDLFLHGLRQVRLDYTPGKADLKHIDRIAHMVEGHPLALVLAAGWIDTLSCAEIADELSQSLDLLATELTDVPERQRSVEATLSQTWTLLKTEEQRIFSRLSIFHGGFDRDAATSVAGVSLPFLSAMLNKSLIQHHPDSGRYELHELMRQFAHRKLIEFDEYEQTCNAHADYYFERLKTWTAHFQARADDSTRFTEPRRDFHNIRSAWNHALEKENIQLIAEAVTGLRFFCTICGYERELIGLIEPAVDLASGLDKDVADRSIEFKLLLALGVAYRNVRGYGEPALERIFGRAWTLSEKQPVSPDLFAALYGFWSYNLITGQLDKSRKVVESFRQRLEQQGGVKEDFLVDAAFVVHCLDGPISLMLGNLQRSQKLLETGMQLDNPHRRKPIIAVYGLNFAVSGRYWLALNYCAAGRLDTALHIIGEAMSIARENAHPFVLAFALAGHAFVCLLRGEAESAIEFANEGLDLCQNYALSFHHYMEIFRGIVIAEKDSQRGLEIVEAALQKLETHANYDLLASLAIESMLRQGEIGMAGNWLDRASSHCDSLGLAFFRAELNRLEGAHAAAVNDRRKAVGCIEKAIKLAKDQSALLLELKATMDLVTIMYPDEDPKPVCRRLEIAIEQFREGFDTAPLMRARRLLEQCGIRAAATGNRDKDSDGENRESGGVCAH